jgi:arabinan endo-1,5-alpha-L-arabinosidase
MAGRFSLPAACAALLAVGGCQGSVDTVASSYGDLDPQNPPMQIEGSLSLTDPTLFRWQDKYWVFSTGTGISVHSSDDLSTFKKEASVFSSNPAWIGQTLPQTTDLWSPDVHAWNGTIHLYYAASAFSTDKSCIGHATTTAIGQSFVDHGPLICSNLNGSTENYNAIDPAVLTSPTDDPWMVFGSWDSGIKLIALDRDGNRRDGNVYSVAARASSDSPAIQAASLYHWRDYYYLFVSFDNSPNHSLRVGRATQVTGPYLDRDRQPMSSGGGTVVLGSSPLFKGAGSNMIFDDRSQRLNVYHAYDTNGVAQLRIGQLFFDNEGWPVAAGP